MSKKDLKKIKQEIDELKKDEALENEDERVTQTEARSIDKKMIVEDGRQLLND